MREVEGAASSTIRRRLAALSSLYKASGPARPCHAQPGRRGQAAGDQSRRRGDLSVLESADPQNSRRAPEDTVAGLRDCAILSVGLQVVRRAEVAMSERLAVTGGPLPREDASIAERVAVLTYLPQYLSAAEQEAVFECRRARRGGSRDRCLV
jgi:hypothetical protein